MGQSTNAILCHGFSFDEEYEFPWGDGEEELEEWWHEINGYSPPFELFNKDGNWLDGKEAPQEKVNIYFAAQRQFLREHPLPMALVLHCSGDYPMFILATPSSVMEAYRGYPKMLDPEHLQVNIKELRTLERFCEQWELEGDGPAWWLVSLWI